MKTPWSHPPRGKGGWRDSHEQSQPEGKTVGGQIETWDTKRTGENEAEEDGTGEKIKETGNQRKGGREKKRRKDRKPGREGKTKKQGEEKEESGGPPRKEKERTRNKGGTREKRRGGDEIREKGRE